MRGWIWGRRAAAALVGGEAALLVGLAVAELVALSSDRLGLGLSTAAFFAICGGGLGLAGWGLWTGRGWSRGPLVAAQLLWLGVSWSARDALPWVAITVAVAAVAVLVLLLRPGEPEEGDEASPR